ncbi:MAG: hypothetical protein MUE84_13795 [Hyphomonas sp.]|nr:hypothetical protein [Hyphomonas sp.]
MRQSDLAELRAGRVPTLATGEAPSVGRALAIEAGDLLVGARGAATETYVGDEVVIGAYVSLDLFLVRPDLAAVDPHFLAAFFDLPSTQAALAAGKQGTGLARLSKEALDTLLVPVLPMARQKAIAELAAVMRARRALLDQLIQLNDAFGREAIARVMRRASESTDNRTKDARP